MAAKVEVDIEVEVEVGESKNSSRFNMRKRGLEGVQDANVTFSKDMEVEGCVW